MRVTEVLLPRGGKEGVFQCVDGRKMESVTEG